MTARALVARLVPARPAARRRAMEAALPEVLDVLRAAIAAGAAPAQALGVAAAVAPPPLAAWVEQAAAATRVGVPAGRALAAAGEAAGLVDLVVAGAALELAATSGAPPGAVLAGVATAAADRLRARQARWAATAQARLSARVVAAMPLLFVLVLAATAPGDAAFLVREPAGWLTLGAAAVLELGGALWAARIVEGER